MVMYGGRRGISGGSGGGMLRTVGRSVARVGFSGNTTSSTTLQESLSSASNKTTAASSTSASKSNGPKKLTASNDSNNFSVSAATCSFSTLPANANYEMAISWPAFDSSPASPSFCCDEFEWVHVDETGDERPLLTTDDYLLGPVPSTDEVQNTVSALQQ